MHGWDIHGNCKLCKWSSGSERVCSGIPMLLLSQGVVASCLSFALTSVLIDPNQLSNVSGDVPSDERNIAGGCRIVKTTVCTSLLAYLALGVLKWKKDNYALVSDWGPVDLLTVCICVIGILIRVWATQKLGRLFSFQVGIRQDHR